MPNTLLNQILSPGAISTLFQPVYSMSVSGFSPAFVECLSRGPVGTNAEHPGVMFEYAELKATEPLVDRACISAAWKIASELRMLTKISVNVFAATLARDTTFVSWAASQISELGLAPSQIIFEIVEHGEAWDISAFLNSLGQIRALGCAIALDDVGLAHSNFQRILEVDAEYLKIDRCIVHECHLDHRKQVLLRCLASLAKDLGSHLIAEGIEQDADLHAVRAQGIELYQGYLFAKPVRASEIHALLNTTFTIPALFQVPSTETTEAISV